ncbi:MAG: BatA domain-containing protein [candidate division Zixibacteria bacterium]|nr:BatA domain-containing protein [candidate division Zixibacteria bacterium]
MINFLNATILLAAAAALIPLIIHLLSRRRVKVVEFSSLRYLKAMQRRQVRRLKIRQWLLLLLRMLIILAAVMAFARPTTKSDLVGSHAAVSAVVLFDNSASMNRFVADGNLFEIARQRTKELLETFGQSDRVSLIPLGNLTGAGEEIAFGSAAVALKKLDLLKINFTRAELETALELAVELLSGARNLNREIYLVTDRQKKSLPEKTLLKDFAAEVYFVDLPLEENDNCGLTAIDFGGQLIQPGYNFDLAATVKNYGLEIKKDILASLFIDGKRVSQTDFEIDAESETEVRFTQAVSRTGFHSGWVEIADDKYMPDNRYYFSFNIPERFNLLVINGDYAGPYMALALVPDNTLGRFWSVKEARPEDLSGVNFDDYDVIFLAGAPELNATYTNRLKSFVRRGKALLVTYGGGTNIDYFNNNWTNVTGVVYREPAQKVFSRAGYYTLQSIEMNHPIFSVYGFEENKPPEIKFYTLPKLSLQDNVRTLIRFSGDRPALVETVFGSGKVLTFTGPMAPEYSDFTGHAFFVPFVSRVAEYLASDLSSLDLRLYTGNRITRSLSLPGSIAYPVELITPDSSRYNIPPEEDQGALVVKVAPTDLPGIYSIRYQGREIDRFAVNIDPAENDLTAADRDRFAAALGVGDYRNLQDDRELASVISEFRYGRELWQLFLWLAVIFVILEIILARSAPPEE